MTIRDRIRDGQGWWDIKAMTGCSNEGLLEEYRRAYIAGDISGEKLRIAEKAIMADEIKPKES